MPPTRPHVVVGVSDKQPQALEFGLAEAARTKAELVVVHAAGMPVGAYDAYSGVTAIGALRQAGELVLQASRDLVTGLMPTVPVHYVLSSMTPASALEHEARGARLIVVGADDVDWFDRMLGGAVADHLVRRSSVPVAVIPEQDPPPSGHGVVVAIDGSTAARRLLQFAFESAEARRAALTVLHATPPGGLADDLKEARLAVSEVIAGWREEFPDVEVRMLFANGAADEACLAATDRAELLIVGRPAGGFAALALTRLVASQVARRAKCPVAVVPMEPEES